MTKPTRSRLRRGLVAGEWVVVQEMAGPVVPVIPLDADPEYFGVGSHQVADRGVDRNLARSPEPRVPFERCVEVIMPFGNDDVWHRFHTPPSRE